MSKKIKLILNEFDILVSKIEENKELHNGQGFKELLKKKSTLNFFEVSMTECHVIECIANNENINGIEIAKQLAMTRGGISKIATRLIKKNIIATYQDNANQKKIFYKLTSIGEEINKIHKQFHEEKDLRVESMISKYSEKEQDIILKFIKDLQKTI